MHLSRTLAAVTAVATSVFAQESTPATGQLGNATVVENNPPGVAYQAVLPEKAFFSSSYPGGNVKGSISAIANPNGIGVAFKVDFSNLPKEGGPFMYHIHVAPVPENGNCTATLAHLDPFIRGETPVCDADLQQTCQVGDLSGKHGNITSDPFTDVYHDQFASTMGGLGSFFGNRSIVIHFSNKTRITCANFELAAGTPPAPLNCTSSAVSGPAAATPVYTTTGVAAGTGAVTTLLPSQSFVPFTGAAPPAAKAATLVGSMAVAGLSLAAIMFML